MAGTVLIQTIRQFDKKDRKMLGQMIGSEFFNRREEVRLLGMYLLKNLDRAEPRLFVPERLFSAAFPGQPYDQALLRHTCSYLLEIVRKRMVLSEIDSDPIAESFLLSKGLRKRGLDAQSGKEITQTMESLEKMPERDARWHLNQYQFHEEQLEAMSTRERSSRLDLRPLHSHLTAFYLAEMLRHACSALTHQAISAQAYNISLADGAMEMAAQGDWLSGFPTIAIYYHACQALRNPEEPVHFETWKSVLESGASIFSPADLRGMYLLGINYCIRKINKREKQFLREAFDLYRSAMEKKVLTEDGWLSGFTYKNIIRIGIEIGEETWTTAFFEESKKLLHPRERESVYRYNQAFISFHRKDYAGTMSLLQGLDLEDTLNLLDARRMLLISYFELGEFQPLESLLLSFGAFLRRQKDLGYHRALYLNLVRFTRRLMDLAPGDQAGRKKLRGEIEASEQVAEQKWLLEQVGG